MQILPDLDNRELFRRINFHGGAYDPSNNSAHAASLGILTCPQRRRRPPQPRYRNPLTSYAGCHHDVEAPIASDNHGVLFLNSHVKFDDIPDGLSYTLFVGEVASASAGLVFRYASDPRNTGHPINRLNITYLGGRFPGSSSPGDEPAAEDIEESINTGMLPVNPTFVGGFGSRIIATEPISHLATVRSGSSARRSIRPCINTWAIGLMESSSMVKTMGGVNRCGMARYPGGAHGALP